MKIIEPILIVGTGRCGTTLFHRLLARHPDVVWLSGVCNRRPDQPWLNRQILRWDSMPFFSSILRRCFPPSETTLYWEYLMPGFSNVRRDLSDSDLLTDTEERAHRELGRHFIRGRTRQVHKFTGWPRLGFLLKLFPDARFIHVIRDGRAVACSFLNVDWWLGWQGPENWLWGPLPPHYDEEWKESDRSFVVLSAIQWKILMDAFETTRDVVPAGQLLELRYEDLTAEPEWTVRRALDFCGLEPSRRVTGGLVGVTFPNRNEKWKKQLTAEQQRLLQKSLAEHLRRYEYE